MEQNASAETSITLEDKLHEEEKRALLVNTVEHI